MKTLHRWFRSGSYSLLGHVNVPERSRRMGVVIVPPFGWEDVCAYRPLRFLAQMLAASGIPVMRFDLPGTGDSSGSLGDPGLMDQWVLSIGAAAGELRAVTGVEVVTLLGIRLGGTLAATAALRSCNVQDLILWAPPLTGRAVLHELRAFAKLERWEYANGAPPPPSEDRFEVGGFLISAEMQRDLETLNLTAISGMGGRRVLVLSLDNLKPDEQLVSALEAAGCAVEVRAGTGYAAMTTLPHEAPPPAAASGAMLEFLTQGPHERRLRPPVVRLFSGATATTIPVPRAEPALERVFAIQYSSGSLFGVLAEPSSEKTNAECCVLLLNAGGVRHTGPNRMWVEAARRWAGIGVASLRLDLLGIGESDGDHNLDIPNMYQEHMVEQVEAAMDSLRLRGYRRFGAVGLCSGAFWAFHAALRRRDVRFAVLLNPRLLFWDPDADRRRILGHAFRGLFNRADWLRLVRGGWQLQDIKRAARIVFGGSPEHSPLRVPAPAHTLEQAWQSMEQNETNVTLVFTEGESLLREMEKRGQMPPAENRFVRLVRIANAGHTFRPHWSQALVHELMDAEIERFALTPA